MDDKLLLTIFKKVTKRQMRWSLSQEGATRKRIREGI